MRRPAFVSMALVTLLALAGVPHTFAGAGAFLDDDEGAMNPDPPSLPDNDEEMNGPAQSLELNGLDTTNDGEDDGTPGQDLTGPDGDEES